MSHHIYNGHIQDEVTVTNHVGDTTRICVSGGYYSADAGFIPAGMRLRSGALDASTFAQPDELIALGRLLIAAGEQTKATIETQAATGMPCGMEAR